MFHVNKGVAGVRMDGIEHSVFDGLIVKDLVNEAPLVSSACGAYEGPHDGGTVGTEEKEGGMGTDVRGISLSAGDVEVIGDRNKIQRFRLLFWRYHSFGYDGCGTIAI
eukprot:TRINITY_DN6860_c1_g1_i2.p1 TRINITY_DN6860_c1_g1~~TRINITY_DN6860_c1_g1_i2.p1  ORF type:complete len:108 (+),score=8.55 TRINITY_DN6860_c1_g1_i2:225-548(+)